MLTCRLEAGYQLVGLRFKCQLVLGGSLPTYGWKGLMLTLNVQRRNCMLTRRSEISNSNLSVDGYLPTRRSMVLCQLVVRWFNANSSVYGSMPTLSTSSLIWEDQSQHLMPSRRSEELNVNPSVGEVQYQFVGRWFTAISSVGDYLMPIRRSGAVRSQVVCLKINARSSVCGSIPTFSTKSSIGEAECQLVGRRGSVPIRPSMVHCQLVGQGLCNANSSIRFLMPTRRWEIQCKYWLALITKAVIFDWT